MIADINQTNQKQLVPFNDQTDNVCVMGCMGLRTLAKSTLLSRGSVKFPGIPGSDK